MMVHVHDDVAVQRRGGFGDAVGAALVVDARHHGMAPEGCHGIGNPPIVGGDGDGVHRTCGSGAAVDVLDHRAPVQVREGLAGESG